MPFLLPPIETEDIRLAALPDIAALRLEAITNRKEEKDFRDVHTLLQQFSLEELLNLDLFIVRDAHFNEESGRRNQTNRV
jgi:predicted nucleotidyltransferase